MARKSLDSRLDRVFDALLPVGSMAHREHYLADDMKEALRIHRTKVDGIISGLENAAPGSAYAAMLTDDLRLPTMPAELRSALGLVDPPTLTVDMSDSEIADAWHRYSQGHSE